jgi:hypothetical protein
MSEEGKFQVEDLGAVWHVVGDTSITAYQELDYLDRTNNKTGIKYAVGPRPLGGTGIAYVRYPKDMFLSADAIRGDPNVHRMLTRCNVCSAMDQLAHMRGGEPSSELLSSSPVPREAVRVNSPDGDRISFGDAAGGNFLPKAVPFILGTLGSLVLRPSGQALLNTSLSVISDLLSGSFTDPGMKKAWQKAADGFITGDMLTPEFADKMRDDFAVLSESLYRDGDTATALKRAMIKGREEILAPRKQVSLQKQQTTTYSVSIGPHDPLTQNSMIG